MPSISGAILTTAAYAIRHVRFLFLSLLFGMSFATLGVISSEFKIPLLYFVIFFGFLYRILSIDKIHRVYRAMILFTVFLGVASLLGEKERTAMRDAFVHRFSSWSHISTFTFYIFFGVFMYGYFMS